MVGIKTWGCVIVLAAGAIGCREAEQSQQPLPQREVAQSRAAETFTVELVPALDAFLRSGAPNQNQGFETYLRLQASGDNRALIGLDAAQIAAVTTCQPTHADLVLQITQNSNNWGSGEPLDVHTMLVPWTEYGATWNCSDDVVPENGGTDCSGAAAWNMSTGAGTLWNSTALSTVTVTNGLSGAVTLDVTSDVLAIAQGGTSYGWLLRKRNEAQSGQVEFGSGESLSLPHLVLACSVDPTPPGGTPETETVVLGSTADDGIRSGEPNKNRGTDSTLRLQATGDNRALLRFDLSGQTLDPADLVSAKLKLSIADTSTTWGDGRNIGSFPLSVPWMELGATWNCPSDSNTGNSQPDCAGSEWAMSGSAVRPYSLAPTGTALIQNGQTGVVELDVTESVRGALAGDPYNGWLIKKTDESSNGRIDFFSKESAQVPQLVLEVVTDHCQGVVCPAATACLQAGVCDPQTGQCSQAPEPAGTSCANADVCDGEETCDGAGVCTPGVAVDPDDFNACTLDSCDPVLGILNEPALEGTNCADATVCNGSETCDALGSCQPGTPPVVDDANPCTADSCDPVNGVNNAPLSAGTSCADADVCNGAELCDGAGACQAGTPLAVDDFNACTFDSCDPISGVSHTVSAAGSSCADGDVCNGDETCDGVGGCVAGTPLVVDDGNVCTVDSCDPVSGVSNLPLPVGAACADEDLCNGDETCDGAGSCSPGTPETVEDDGNACTDDLCDPLTGAVLHPALPEGTSCADDNLCNGAELCDGAGTCQPGSTLDLEEDADPCTLETCDPVTGIITRQCPPVAPDVVTTVLEGNSWLYADVDPIQVGVDPSTIQLDKAALLSGFVRDRDGAPILGAVVSVLGHPEFGETVSQLSGAFQMVINGGGAFTLVYEHPDYLPSQRLLDVPWNDTIRAPDVVLVPLDPGVMQVDLLGSIETQVVEGTPTIDADGARQATVLVPPGTEAELHFSDGATAPLSSMNLRITEYTVGDAGPESMPGELPPTSDYTYAVEISADEAIAAGATSVQFTQPLPVHIDNFLFFPSGTIVPVGYYDRERGVWVPMDSGIVLDIVDIQGGLAQLDADDDGIAESPAALAVLGINADEQTSLAERYIPGDSIWRIQVEHLTPIDCNWRAGPPDGAEPPPNAAPEGGSGGPQPTACQETNASQGDDQQAGSIIRCSQQSLHEEVPIAGTPFSLNYASDRTQGRKSAYRFSLPISEDTVPAPLKRIQAQVLIAGRESKMMFPAVPGQNLEFTWDGLDFLGRALRGVQRAGVTVDYVYDPAYTRTPVFGDRGDGIVITGDRARNELFLRRKLFLALGVSQAIDSGLGGWTLTPHHAYDPVWQVLYRGDGTHRSAASRGDTLTRIAGVAGTGPLGDGGPAINARVVTPWGAAVGPDGSVYISQQTMARVRRIAPNGIITTFAGNGNIGFSGDGGPATSARLNQTFGLAVGPDNSVYIADPYNRRVRRVRPDGIIETFAGNGSLSFSGDGGLATAAGIGNAFDVAVSPSGNVYITGTSRIRKIDTSGIITTVAGNGSTSGSIISGQPAKAVPISTWTVAVDKDEVLYITDDLHERTYRVDTEGNLYDLAGGSTAPYAHSYQSGRSATDVWLFNPFGIDVDRAGNVYVTASTYTAGTTGGTGIFKISPDGIVTTFAGRVDTTVSASSGIAANTALDRPGGIAVGEDGVYFVEINGDRVRRVGPGFPQLALGDRLVASDSGEELYYFDSLGRHLKTVNTITKATMYQFTYEPGTRQLSTVTDVYGNVTTIHHDSNGNPTSIESPYGQITTLGVDDNGYLTSISDPLSQTITASYTADGLMQVFTDARNQSAFMTYDSDGRLSTDTDRAGSLQTLTVDPDNDNENWSVQLETGEGHVRTISRAVADDESKTWTTNFPNGTQSIAQVTPLGTHNVFHPDGMVSVSQLLPDPRFGVQSPRFTTKEITPSGLQRTTSEGRSVTLINSSDPLSLNSLTVSQTINGKTWSSAYNPFLLRYIDTTPVGRTTTRYINNKGATTRIERPGFTTIDFTYDGKGRLTKITQGARVTTNTYATSGPENGYLQSIKNALNQTTQFTPDALGRTLVQTEPDGAEIGFGWDENSNLTEVTPPGQPTHTQGYSPVDQMASYEPPVLDDVPNPETTYTYNLDRQPLTTTRPDGLSLTRSYDSAGRLSLLTLPTGNVQYDYYDLTPCPGCAPGSLKSITGPGSSVLDFTYDGALLTSTTWSGDVNGGVQWTHDNDFRIQTETLVPGGDTITYAYDNDNLVTCASRGTCVPPSTDALRLTYSSTNGLLTQATIGNLVETYTYNTFGELATHTARYSGNIVYQGVFHSTAAPRDNLGRITRKVETVLGTTRTDDYQYDTRGRLLNVARDGDLVSVYEYDDNGNRLSLSNPTAGTTTLGSYDDQDRVVTYGNFDYEFNENGDLVSKTDTVTGDVTTYEYDVRGSLLSVVLPDSTEVEYVIDGQGRRVGKKVDGVLVQGFVYKDGLRVAAELDGLGNVVSQFVYVDDDSHSPDFMIKGGQVYRFVADQLGSTRLVVDVLTGIPEQVLEYDEFGNVLSDSSPAFQPFGYAGGIYDGDTAFVRFGVRDYDASIGRWTAKDPVGFAAGENHYIYVDNNPITLLDPTGLMSERELYERLRRQLDGLLAIRDFYRNYNDMKDANTIGADKYFHCMANCEAAARGRSDVAETISDTREWLDEHVKRDPHSACQADQNANHQGRNSGARNKRECRKACASLRPKGLNPKY